MVRIHRKDILRLRDARLGELRGLSGEGSVTRIAKQYTLRSGIGLKSAQRASVAEGIFYL